ncbi:virulence factor BrkB family protein [Vibrio salinus]|uniref:virulence factor BrkB family protein n=1 Tax=Vibrio salinus TaxID=2899784 RepID=UPI003563CFC3
MPHRFRQVLSCLNYTYYRISKDRINVSAGYLAYITLLSLVPMMTVLISVFSSVSAFSDASEVIHKFVIDNFVPAAGDAVSHALQSFVANTGKMTALGGTFLFVTAIMLISNIDKSLNVIWRTTKKRRWVFSFSMYWMALTLGPILVGASLAVSSYITSLKILESETLTGAYHLLLSKLPFLLSFFAFCGLYLVVPNKRIYISHAATGAFVAAVLFELSKVCFSLYVTHFPSYQLIYGALAAIPILFVWVYLCWIIVLIGAEVTASMGEKEHWAVNMVNSAEENDTKQDRDSSDSADTKSK